MGLLTWIFGTGKAGHKQVDESIKNASCGCRVKEGKIFEMCGTAKYDNLNMESCYSSGMQIIGNIQKEKLMKHLNVAIDEFKLLTDAKDNSKSS